MRDGRVAGEIFIEGLRLAEEAVAANLEITDCFFTNEFAETERAANLIKKLADARPVNVSAKLLASISDTQSPQGIVILAEKPATGKTVLEETLTPNQTALFVILHKINNPANVGAILRTAEAAGAAGAVLTRNSADVFSPKSLRGAMGSAFRLPIWTNADFAQVVEFCRQREIKTICAELNAAKTHSEIDWTTGARALVIGSEAHGLTPEEIALCDKNLRIPMQGAVESLNAAVACGVILYEAQRQRNL